MEASEPPLAPAEPWWANSFMVTFAFRCNIACTFCMVEDALGTFEGTSAAAFRRFAETPGALDGKKRIIFSGGEVTLAKDLLEYVAIARSVPSVEHVRLQTNAIRLGDRAYLRSLLDAGVDEYFVSFHAPDAALYDAIAQRKGTFDGIVRGLSALHEAGATLITNTAIVETNHRVLPAIVEAAAAFAPRSMEFWNYWPRGDETGERQLAARISDVRAPLIAALEAVIARRIPPVVKWFPRCLLGPYAWCQDDGQPPALLEDRYWEREPEYSCLYEGVCAESMGRPPDRSGLHGKCAGLSDTYVQRFGWEEQLLQPVRRAGATGKRERGPTPDRPAPRAACSLTRDAGPRRTAQAALASWLAGRGLLMGQEVAGFRLAGMERGREAVLLVFTAAGASISVSLGAQGRGAALTRPVPAALEGRAAALVNAVGEQMDRAAFAKLAAP